MKPAREQGKGSSGKWKDYQGSRWRGRRDKTLKAKERRAASGESPPSVVGRVQGPREVGAARRGRHELPVLLTGGTEVRGSRRVSLTPARGQGFLAFFRTGHEGSWLDPDCAGARRRAGTGCPPVDGGASSAPWAPGAITAGPRAREPAGPDARGRSASAASSS